MTIGNPVRDEIAALEPPEKRLQERTKPARLLVFGGSLGADAINQLLPKALAKLPQDIRPEVRHQTGDAHHPRTVQAYADLGVQAEVVPFIHAMDKAYAWADVVLCRAGALTIAELCAAGLGAILIPYPFAVDDHQTANANFMVNHQAAWLAKQATLTEDILANMLKELCESTERRVAMAIAAYQIRTIDASDRILNICKEICH
jgi:UDP-N-acetylglucosamine--N-acetylmuramyl-(pentapeptide) pyrophosphoryl-undecaprenol N-acetylglucosamine transferase